MEGRNILIIDDSNTNLVLLESLLQKNGYIVTSALTAREGLETLKVKMPDLIYLDLLMPEIDGLEFLKILKSKDEWKEIPVVVLSAINDMDVIRKSRDLGVTDYITKPLNIHKLIELTKTLLKN